MIHKSNFFINYAFTINKLTNSNEDILLFLTINVKKLRSDQETMKTINIIYIIRKKTTLFLLPISMDHFLIKLFDEVLSQAELVSTNLNYILHDLLDESKYCIGLALELFLLFLLL